MELIFRLLHLPESLGKYDVCITAYVNQNIVDYETFDYTRDNHVIFVRVIFKTKIVLREGNRNMGCMVLGHLHAAPFSGPFFCYLLLGSKLEPPVMERISFSMEADEA